MHFRRFRSFNRALSLLVAALSSACFAVLLSCGGHGQGLGPVVVKLAWDANEEPDLAGYKTYAKVRLDTIYLGSSVDTFCTVVVLAEKIPQGTDYITFYVTAIDTAGNESEFSEGADLFILWTGGRPQQARP